MSKQFFDSFSLFSPPITFFYNEKKNHSNLSSFIVTILGILAFLFFTIYYFILMITRQKFTAYRYDGYEKIAPEIKGDKTGFFHYFTFDIIQPNDKFISISGYDSNKTYEYIYGKCTEENMKGYENLITDKEKFLTYGYCIQKSVKLSDGNITLVTDKNFVWPTIAEGGNFNYYFEINKCSNTSNLFNGVNIECASEEEINNYLKKEYGGTVYILDNYVDVGSFKNPITTIFYDLDLQISSQTYSVYHIIYDLGEINCHHNLITDEITKINTIIFSRIESSSAEKPEGQTDNTMAIIYFWRSSKLKVYERKYDGLLNFLTNIGGIYQIIMRICSIIDLCFSGYAELIDSKNLYNNTKKNVKKNSKSKNKVNKINKYLKMNISNNNKCKYINCVNNEKSINSKRELMLKNIKRGRNNIITNEIKNIDMNNKNIGFFEYLTYLFFGCFNENKEILKYLDIRKKILSEEFLYQLYFENYDENFKFDYVVESKENLIVHRVENTKTYDTLQNSKANSA